MRPSSAIFLRSDKVLESTTFNDESKYTLSAVTQCLIILAPFH